MIIYRIFLGFCEICVFLYICFWFQSARCSPSWPLLSALFRHAHRYYLNLVFSFFCTQEKSFSFLFVLTRCDFISPPLYVRAVDEQFTCCSELLTYYIVFCLSACFFFFSVLPVNLVVSLCFIKCPESSPCLHFESHPPCYQLGSLYAAVQLKSQRDAATNSGAFKTRLDVEVFLENLSDTKVTSEQSWRCPKPPLFT